MLYSTPLDRFNVDRRRVLPMEHICHLDLGSVHHGPPASFSSAIGFVS